MTGARKWTQGDTARLLRVPGPDDDKYSRGVVGLRTGSAEYPGAAVLGVEAAWRAGAGFVRFVGAGRAADAVIARRPETVAAADAGHTRVDAWVIGSGTDAAARTLDETAALRRLLRGSAPVVVDAGALDLVEGATAPMVLTPHAGEFTRLREQLRLRSRASGDRSDDVAALARELNTTVLLKGSHTLIADAHGKLLGVANAPGWLATAGSGDVLAGILGTLLAATPGAPAAEVAASAAWLHGHAAALAAGTAAGRAGRPIVALDVVAAVPRAIEDLLS